IEKNECYKNAYASARSANGIYVNDSWDNDFLTNRLHDNQDSGITFTTGANDNLCVQNRSWKNGDHGYDHVRATGNRHIGDVSFGNLNDGFSIEGSATGQVLYNCISVDNGI